MTGAGGIRVAVRSIRLILSPSLGDDENARARNFKESARGCEGWQGSLHLGRRICARRRPGREAWRQVRQAGNCHRIVQGAPRWRKAGAAQTYDDQREHASEGQKRFQQRPPSRQAIRQTITGYVGRAEERASDVRLIEGFSSASTLECSAEIRKGTQCGRQESRRDAFRTFATSSLEGGRSHN
jgi:hypothetical protein